MGRLLCYLMPYKKQVVLVIFISLLLSLLTLTDAWIMGRLSDAIFYQTKGIPISLSWNTAKIQLKSFQISLVKDSPWQSAEQEVIATGLAKRGFSVINLKPMEGNMLLGQVEIASEAVSDPLEAANDLQKQFKAQFEGIRVFIASGMAKTENGRWVLFKEIHTVFLLPLLLIGVYLIRGVFKFGQEFMVGSIGQKLVMRLRNEIYQNLQNLSISYFERNSSGQSGQLISRVTNDIDGIRFLFTDAIVDVVLEPMVVVLGLIWGFIMNWKLTLMFFLVFPFLAFPVNKLSRKLRSVNRDMMDKVADITSVMEETLGGIKVVKAFGMEKYEVDRFKRETRQSYQASLKGLRLGTFFSPIINFLVTLALAIFLTYGGSLILQNKLSPGEFFTFIFLMSFMASPIRRISSLFSKIPRAMAAGERIFELIDQRSEVTEVEHPVSLPEISGKVEFDQVSFGYQADKIVLRDINLTVEPGEVVALVGPSGAGKTTMINLVARFYDPSSGAIRIDGVNLRELKLDVLRKQMGIVPQETILFRGTVADNIGYGRLGATQEEIEVAARAANAHEFIEKMPDGYQTRVGARGATLSGGQRQRIAIARALLRDPKILILDEATSALDTQSEVLVQDALKRLMKGRTSFVIAHRLSTIRSAHRIVVMDAGKIVEMGTHEELLVKDGLYAMLYRTQFRNQEMLQESPED